MITVKDIKNGKGMAGPVVYVDKPYIVTGTDNVVLHAGTIESIEALASYYDDCAVKVRIYDLHLNDNAKVSTPKKSTHGGAGRGQGRKPRQAPKAKSIWCGQISEEQRDRILQNLTPAERLAALLQAAEAKRSRSS